MIYSSFNFPTPPQILGFLCAVGFLGGIISTEPIQAEDWMFRRSYYTHALPPEQIEQFPPPERRTAYRPAFRGVTPGFGIRGVYRYNRIQLGRGRNADVTIYGQNWFELEP